MTKTGTSFRAGDVEYMSRHKVLNTPAIRRMPLYYHKLILMQNSGEETVSTSLLAEYMNLEPIVVRKDLELTGVSGSRGRGYSVTALIEAMREFLGWNRWLRACLVGAGSLGTSLLGFPEFSEYGLNICEVFDSSPRRIGCEIYGRLVKDVARMGEVLAESRVQMAILCVPACSAQNVADELVKCGVRLIWNFSNTCLQLPPDVIVQREVIAGGFALLSRKFKEYSSPEEE
jgi:redox-sensing transcriptional repressor